MASLPHIPNGDSKTLFFLVTAMLVYRSIDLLTTRAKLEQMAVKNPILNAERVDVSAMRHIVRICGDNARIMIPHVRFIMFLRREFLAGMMLLYLFILLIIGLWTQISNALRSGTGESFVVAIATGLVSLIASAVNFELEKVKIRL
jgi:hypothetical protein